MEKLSAKEKQARNNPIGFIKKYQVSLMPILEKGKPALWFAGYRWLTGDGYANFIPADKFVIEKTIAQALISLSRIRRRP